MKTRFVYYSVGLIFFTMILVLWKLNDTYKVDRSAQRQNQMHTQVLSLTTSVASQLSQIKNTLSTYSHGIDESKVNWVQLKPFVVLGEVTEDEKNELQVHKVVNLSGSSAESWSAKYVQQALSYKVNKSDLVRVQLFQDHQNVKYVALVFFESDKSSGSRLGTLVISEANLFQRFFDAQRTSKVVHLLETSENVVAAHTEVDYVGSVTEESKMSDKSFFIEQEQIRGTNLNVFSYSSKKSLSGLSVPYAVIGLVIGLGFLISGILIYSAAPLEQALEQVRKKQREEMFKKTFEETSRRTQQQSEQALQVQVVPSVAAAAPAHSALSDEKNLKSSAQNESPISMQPALTEIVYAGAFDPGIEQVQAATLVQTVVQQCLFNLDRQIKNSGFVIEKDFTSTESVRVDYQQLIKAFQYVLEAFVHQGAVGSMNKISVRTYDADRFTVVELSVFARPLEMAAEFLNFLKSISCELKTHQVDGRQHLKFIFERQAVVQMLKEKPNMDTVDGAEPMIENQARDLAADAGSNSSIEDLDIDSILSLDESLDEKVIESEMKATKFKIGSHIEMIEDPQIDMEPLQKKSIDQFEVKIRKPEKA